MALYDPHEFPAEAPVHNEDADILARARELVQRGWCQGYVALDRDGRSTPVLGDEAVSFCSYGAVIRARGKTGVLDGATDAYWAALNAVTGGDAIGFNEAEGRTQAEVVEALRKAAELARQEQVA